MNYSKEDLLLDYAHRTKKNLEFIEETVRADSDKEVYEVTQLVNSLLGLLVFPFEKMRSQIPNKSLNELKLEGWIVPEVIGSFPQVKNLYQLIRTLRNAVAHFNIEFFADSNNQIKGGVVWNVNRDDQIDWKAKMSIAELRNNVYRFIDLILSE